MGCRRPPLKLVMALITHFVHLHKTPTLKQVEPMHSEFPLKPGSDFARWRSEQGPDATPYDPGFFHDVTDYSKIEVYC